MNGGTTLGGFCATRFVHIARVARAAKTTWHALRHQLATWSSQTSAPFPRVRVEDLERRQLLAAAAFSDGNLTLTGDTGLINTFSASLTSDGKRIWGIADNTGRLLDASLLKSITINTASASDKISV